VIVTKQRKCLNSFVKKVFAGEIALPGKFSDALVRKERMTGLVKRFRILRSGAETRPQESAIPSRQVDLKIGIMAKLPFDGCAAQIPAKPHPAHPPLGSYGETYTRHAKIR